MIYLLLYLFLSTLPIVTTVTVQCYNNDNPVQSSFPDADDVLLKSNYKVTIRYTNWITRETAKFVESRVSNSSQLKKLTPAASYALYNVVNDTVYYKSSLSNGTEITQECHRLEDKAELNFYQISPIFANFFNVTGDKFSDILEAVITSKRYSTSSLDTTGTNITAGVSTIGWLGCALNVEKENITIQANVYYAGNFSQKPYSGAFNNPLVYSIHLQAYERENSTIVNITDHVSFDIVTIDRLKLRHTPFSLPRGMFCENMSRVEVPDNLPSHFSTHIRYHENDQIIDDIDLIFDASESIYSFALNFTADRDFPFVGKTKFDANAHVVHDFKYGLQYVMSRNGTYCFDVEPIDQKMGDVWINKTNVLFMRTPGDVLTNLTNEDFYYAGKVIDSTGLILDSYVSRKHGDKKSELFTVIELLYLKDVNKINSTLHSIVLYHNNNSNLVERKSTIAINSKWIEGFHLADIVKPCLKTITQEMFFINLQNVSVSAIYRIGPLHVQKAIVKELARIGQVSTLRITNFMFTQMDDSLVACFMVSERPNSKQAKTAYLMPDLTVDVVRINLNTSINGTDTFNASVVTPSGKLIITSNKFGSFPLNRYYPNPMPVMGYSASSMFVLGFFMFIFGAVTVVGCRLFYKNRNEIRGIAYQVFE